MNNSEINENVNINNVEDIAIKGIIGKENSDEERFDSMEVPEKVEIVEVSSNKEITKDTSMSEGFAIAVAGFIIVFFILVLISVILSLLKYTNTEKNEEENPKPIVPETTEEPVEEEIPIEVIENESDDLELVAVITACIAASMNTSADKLIVRSIRKLTQWNIEAKYDQQRINYLS